MSDKKRYAIEAVQLALVVLEEFNKLDLANLELTEGGAPLPITPEILNTFKFVGLPNYALVDMRFWETTDQSMPDADST